jgi:hypothetical protein
VWVTRSPTGRKVKVASAEDEDDGDIEDVDLEDEDEWDDITAGTCDLDLAAIEGNLLANKVLSSTAKVNVKVTLVPEDEDDGDIEDVDLEDEDEWDDITATTPLSLEKERPLKVTSWPTRSLAALPRSTSRSLSSCSMQSYRPRRRG